MPLIFLLFVSMISFISLSVLSIISSLCFANSKSIFKWYICWYSINCFKSFDESPDFINNKISLGEGLFEKYYENDNESIFDFYQNDEEEHLFFRNCNNL